jgi:hypothetical protein
LNIHISTSAARRQIMLIHLQNRLVQAALPDMIWMM